MRDMIRRELPFFCAVPAVVWHIFFAIVPVVIILLMSFRVVDDGGLLAWSLEHYVAICTQNHALILLRSLFLAAFTAITCLVMGYPVAYYLAFYAARWRIFLLLLVALPLLTNFLTLAYAWFFVLDRTGLLNRLLLFFNIIGEPLIFVYTMPAVLCVMVYCFLPFMIMPLYAALEKIDRRLLEASQDLGATPWQTFLRVTLPLSLSGIKTGLLLVFIPAFGEFVIPIVVGGSRYLYVGSTIMHYLMHPASERIGGAFTVVSGMLLGTSIVIGASYINALYRSMKKG